MDGAVPLGGRQGARAGALRAGLGRAPSRAALSRGGLLEARWSWRRRGWRSWSVGALRSLLCCACLAGLAACEDRGSALRELARVSEAVGRLREASNADKRPLLGALQAVECDDTEVRALRDLCVSAYTLHLQALDGIAAARSETRRGAELASPRLAELLAQSEAMLRLAKHKAERCVADEARLLEGRAR